MGSRFTARDLPPLKAVRGFEAATRHQSIRDAAADRFVADRALRAWEANERNQLQDQEARKWRGPGAGEANGSAGPFAIRSARRPSRWSCA